MRSRRPSFVAAASWPRSGIRSGGVLAAVRRSEAIRKTTRKVDRTVSVRNGARIVPCSCSSATAPRITHSRETHIFLVFLRSLILSTADQFAEHRRRIAGKNRLQIERTDIGSDVAVPNDIGLPRKRYRCRTAPENSHQRRVGVHRLGYQVQPEILPNHPRRCFRGAV